MFSLKLVNQLILLLLLLVGCWLARAEDDHRFSCEPQDDGQHDPWIRNLVNEHQLFFANIEIVDLTSQSISLLDETYDFLNEIGEYKFEHRCAVTDGARIDYAKYFRDSVYKYSNSTNKCSKHRAGDAEVQEFILQWLPKGNSLSNSLLGAKLALLTMSN